MRALLLVAVVCGCLVVTLAAQPLAPPAPAGPVRVGGNIKPPAKIRHVPPVYPQDALAARVAGIVIVEANIGTDGIVADARVLRGVPMLNDAAIESVKQWQYEPTLLNGTAVPVIMTVTVNFSLGGPNNADSASFVGGSRVDGTVGLPPGGASGAPPANTNPYLVTPNGVGLVSIGMTLQSLTGTVPPTQLRTFPRRTMRGVTPSVEIALEPGGPPALVADLFDNQVLQIAVRSNRFRTADGFGVGTSLGELRKHEPKLIVVMCDRGPCAIGPSQRYAFELDAPVATASDLAQVPDTALVTGVLVAPAPAAGQLVRPGPPPPRE